MSDAALSIGDPEPMMFSSEAETRDFGQALAACLCAGDWVSLIGPLGAGKTALARSLIQARLGPATEVPSPSYTLVNVYAGIPEIWHADLYRLSDPEEAEELGLLDDLADRIVVAEWPERLGPSLPARRLELRLDFDGEQGRLARLSRLGDWKLEGLS
ncbi:MAG: tRNA (adenosine(37)-N6)-threonylcarbamoyltransferase complex ATPase subunit type 1 TsaE [Pseudomonadota bacterium]